MLKASRGRAIRRDLPDKSPMPTYDIPRFTDICFRDPAEERGNITEAKYRFYERISAYAHTKGGRLLSDIDDLIKEKPGRLQWQCRLGHEWSRSWVSERSRGSWCPVCQKVREKAEKLAEMREHARSHGGFVHAKEYLGGDELYRWECRQGHTWMQRWNMEKLGLGWCPYCDPRSHSYAGKRS